MTKMKPTAGNLREEGKPVFGTCRIEPPKVFAGHSRDNVHRNEKSFSFVTKWPSVCESDWCGEYE